MALEYSIIEDKDGGSYLLQVNSYTLVKIFFKTDRVASPITKEKAEELINTIKCMVESEYPVSELNGEDYEPSDFHKMLEKMDEEDVFKMMMMGALLG